MSSLPQAKGQKKQIGWFPKDYVNLLPSAGSKGDRSSTSTPASEVADSPRATEPVSSSAPTAMPAVAVAVSAPAVAPAAVTAPVTPAAHQGIVSYSCGNFIHIGLFLGVV